MARGLGRCADRLGPRMRARTLSHIIFQDIETTNCGTNGTGVRVTLLRCVLQWVEGDLLCRNER